MKPLTLHQVYARIKRLPLHHQIAELRAIIALEKPYSVRRNEFTSLLEGKIRKQLRRETRAA